MNMIPTFCWHANSLAREWENEITHSDARLIQKEMTQQMGNLTLNILTDAVFGCDLSKIEGGSEASQHFSKWLSLFTLGLSFTLWWYHYLPTPSNLRFLREMRALRRVVENIIAYKRQELKNVDRVDQCNDLLTALLVARDSEGNVLSDRELFDNVMTFFFAGHETTSLALCWTFYALHFHPHVAQKAREEIERVRRDSEEPLTEAELQQLAYLNNVIKEVLRLYAPAPVILREAVKSDVIAGYQIPKGTVVSIAPAVLHRLPLYWERPDDFLPERWETATPSAYVYQPFHVGSRSCIGSKFALTELKAVLAVLLPRFRFRLVDGYVVKKVLRITLRPDPGLMMNITKL
jgi:cytochrome P450